MEMTITKSADRPIPMEYLDYGDVKIEAKRFKMDLQRAYKLVEGKVKVSRNDHKFIEALLDKAIVKKRLKDKLKQLAA